MALRLLQYRLSDGGRALAAIDEDGAATRLAVETTYALASAALRAGQSLTAAAQERVTGETVDLERVMAEKRFLAPIDHPDPTHLHLTGTGLTHLGSAEGRDQMHRAAAAGQETDSIRMFRMGLEGGKPEPGAEGAQPEWFYKGNGSSLVGHDAILRSLGFALDGSEEPEIAGIYIIDDHGAPWRIGFALANEFSDHVTERGNYLWLAHSKLRPAALGAEILTGPLPWSIIGTSRIQRDGVTIWEKPFLTGEDNMSHSIDNLERHHFKYPLFRQAGDVHVHFFGTATLSFTDGIRTREGDIFEIEAAPFRFPLRNTLGAYGATDVAVRML